MKPRLALVALLLCSLAPLATHASAQSTPNVTLVQRTEGEALAKGYEEAFKLITSTPVFLTFERAGQPTRTLAGVREVKAVGAILVITSERGPVIAIPAANVVQLSNERPGNLL